MRARLNSGRWVDINTRRLSGEIYIATDGGIYFDEDIAEIRDDARIGKGRCRWCGATVAKGEEEAHYLEREATPCEECLWYLPRVFDRQEQRQAETKDGIITETRTVITKSRRECAYKDSSKRGRTDCTCKDCRAYGIEWFTPENTPRLRK